MFYFCYSTFDFQVNSDAEGEYICLIKWGRISIKSSAATLTVRSITTPPQPTNAAVGAEAKFSCFAKGDSEATITLHKTVGHEEVGSVATTTQNNADSTITTSGVITISNVNKADHAGDYYCKAVWNTNIVTSDNVALSVLDLIGSTATVWSVSGAVAEFQCSSDVLLKANSGGDPYLVSGEKVNADTSVSWEYFDTTDSSWKSTNTVTR